MSDILNHGLRDQLAAAMAGWGGGHATPRTSAASTHTVYRVGSGGQSGQETPKAAPASPGHQKGYLQGLLDFAGEHRANSTNPDRSMQDANENLTGHLQHPRQPAPKPRPAAEKALPPLPVDSPLASPQPEMSCRISRFPFSHPCEMPELMPDEDLLGAAATTTPTVSGPATPNVAGDVFRPLTQIMSPDLELHPIPGIAAEPELHDGMRSMSLKSARSELSDGLGIIQEEADVNADGVSILTPTEVSFGNSTGEADFGRPRANQESFLTVQGRAHSTSVSSLGSGSMSSSDWRPNQARRSIHFFSRMRNGGRGPPEEDFLERRSLTPAQLTAPHLRPSHGDEELLTPASPMSPAFSPVRPQAEAVSATSRFFQRMPWMGDTQSKKAEAVFGVDLKDSIRVAPMKIRISHKGRSTSYRTFPISVHKCGEYIRRAGHAHADVFSSVGNAYNVAQLKAIFSQAPSYGEDFEFDGSQYTVYDAAKLILAFLEELPKPLISSSVVKSWILLARQEGAIEPPCPRVETGLDFWTEALNRLPTASRNLTKHLLTLFAEVLLAATGGVSEVDARQLASAVSKAFFHQDADGGEVVGDRRSSRDAKKKPVRRNVQPTLALAFLIKKRGEYAVALGEASGRGSSKRDSKMFLPSTREMMEWKSLT